MLIGVTVARIVPANVMSIAAGLAFFAFAAWTFRGDRLSDDDQDRATRTSGSVALGIGVAFFLAELGDKTMLATVDAGHDGRADRRLARLDGGNGRGRRDRHRDRGAPRGATARAGHPDRRLARVRGVRGDPDCRRPRLAVGAKSVARDALNAGLTARVYGGGMAKQSKLHPIQPPEAEVETDEGPIDDMGSLTAVTGSQAANGLPQGLTAVVLVYAAVRLIGPIVRMFTGGRKTRA